MNIARLIISIGIILILASCGKKGPVRPLLANLPNAVSHVELRQSGDVVLLSWQLPTHNQNGTLLEPAPTVDIYRMLFDPADECLECKDRSTLLHSIDPELPQPAQLKGQRYLLRDQQVAANQGYHYRLVPRNADGLDGHPLIVRIVFAEPPVAPTGFTVEAHDRSTAMSWTPLQPAEGQELLGYRIYRQHVGDFNAAKLLNNKPLTDTKYDDLNLENGREYRYQLRALLKRGELMLESLPSPIESVVPEAGQ